MHTLSKLTDFISLHSDSGWVGVCDELQISPREGLTGACVNYEATVKLIWQTKVFLPSIDWNRNKRQETTHSKKVQSQLKAGPEPTSTEPTGPEPTCPELIVPEPTGPEPTSPETTGLKPTSTEQLVHSPPVQSPLVQRQPIQNNWSRAHRCRAIQS